MLDIVGETISFVMLVLALPISPVIFLTQAYRIFAQVLRLDARIVEFTVAPEVS